jgi:hypothetical protein
MVVGFAKSLSVESVPITTEVESSNPAKILVVFFRDRYFRFITMKYTRIVLIPVFIAIVCVFGYYASSLEPDNEEVS